MRWVRWYRGSRLEEQPSDGERVRVRLRFDAQHEAVMFALSLGAQAELVDPPELRAQIAAAAAETTALYAAPTA
jgi:predicted DNA-binding transcriptional regulator YafY